MDGSQPIPRRAECALYQIRLLGRRKGTTDDRCNLPLLLRTRCAQEDSSRLRSDPRRRRRDTEAGQELCYDDGGLRSASGVAEPERRDARGDGVDRRLLETGLQCAGPHV